MITYKKTFWIHKTKLFLPVIFLKLLKNIYRTVFKENFVSNNVVLHISFFNELETFWVIVEMTTRDNSSTKKKANEVTGWHRIPTLNKVQQIKWLQPVKQATLLPSDKKNYISSLHFADNSGGKPAVTMLFSVF